MKVNRFIVMTENQYRDNLYKLHTFIKQSNIPPIEICKKCGITYSTLYNIETGRSLGNPKTWDKLANYFAYDFVYKLKKDLKNENIHKINKLKTVSDYVIPLLKHYGNAYIGEKSVKRFGKSEILSELESNGIKCFIKHADEAGGYILEVIH